MTKHLHGSVLRVCLFGLIVILVPIVGNDIIYSAPTATCGESADILSQHDPIFSEACGPVNLYVALRLLGKTPSYEKLLRLCSITETGRASLAKLKEAADLHGIVAVPVELNMNALERLDELVILHLAKPKDHFILFLGWSDGKCKVIDATRKAKEGFVRYVEARKIEELWDGYGLILSKSPVSLSRQRNISKIVSFGILAGCSCVLFALMCFMISGKFKQIRQSG